jgi:hypothetical protein
MIQSFQYQPFGTAGGAGDNGDVLRMESSIPYSVERIGTCEKIEHNFSSLEDSNIKKEPPSPVNFGSGMKGADLF